MSAKHSPGPWLIAKGGIIERSNGQSIATTCTDTWQTEDEEQANACLIAAAPDLLAELKIAETFLDDLIRAPKVKYDRDLVLAGFRAAIQKATT